MVVLENVLAINTQPQLATRPLREAAAGRVVAGCAVGGLEWARPDGVGDHAFSKTKRRTAATKFRRLD